MRDQLFTEPTRFKGHFPAMTGPAHSLSHYTLSTWSLHHSECGSPWKFGRRSPDVNVEVVNNLMTKMDFIIRILLF